MARCGRRGPASIPTTSSAPSTRSKPNWTGCARTRVRRGDWRTRRATSTGVLPLALETHDGVASTLLASRSSIWGSTTWTGIPDIIAAISREDVREAARRISIPTRSRSASPDRRSGERGLAAYGDLSAVRERRLPAARGLQVDQKLVLARRENPANGVTAFVHAVLVDVPGL